MLGFKMNKAIITFIIILGFGFSVIYYHDFRAHSQKNSLHNESLRIGELITKYDQILKEADSIRTKYEVLKTKNTDNDEFNSILEKSERFLDNAKRIKIKRKEKIEEYNEISERYDRLPRQIVFLKRDLPIISTILTQHQPSADR
jgi:hypothetical protein